MSISRQILNARLDQFSVYRLATGSERVLANHDSGWFIHAYRWRTAHCVCDRAAGQAGCFPDLCRGRRSSKMKWLAPP